MNSIRKIFRSVGPAIIVAAVVLGPGSILTSSQVGASYGPAVLPVLVLAVALMIAMVALSGRLGVSFEGSLCDELAGRLGRWVAVAVGVVLFLVVALFQSSNNMAIIAGIEPLFDSGGESGSVLGGFGARTVILVGVNVFVIFCLYAMRDLYGVVEKLMKLLVMVLAVSFIFNFIVVLMTPRGFVPVVSEGKKDLVPLLGMIGTTFSVAGAFYQAYLVREKGWQLGDVKKNLTDSVVSISVLGGITAIILLTAARVFYGRPEAVELASVGDVARQLEPLFGAGAKVVFCLGIFAGALSSFLVNAIIGGTVFSDSLGLGYRMDNKWPRHLTTVALLVGMAVGILRLMDAKGTVALITLAQALTVFGLPALAAALLYLGTRPDLTGDRRVPRWIIVLAAVGFVVACVVAVRMGMVVWEKVM